MAFRYRYILTGVDGGERYSVFHMESRIGEVIYYPDVNVWAAEDQIRGEGGFGTKTAAAKKLLEWVVKGHGE